MLSSAAAPHYKSHAFGSYRASEMEKVKLHRGLDHIFISFRHVYPIVNEPHRPIQIVFSTWFCVIKSYFYFVKVIYSNILWDSCFILKSPLFPCTFCPCHRLPCPWLLIPFTCPHPRLCLLFDCKPRPHCFHLCLVVYACLGPDGFWTTRLSPRLPARVPCPCVTFC